MLAAWQQTLRDNLMTRASYASWWSDPPFW
jgi:hypothetical protein